jgi:asparagine synthase (glutamine-hydrolysing)
MSAQFGIWNFDGMPPSCVHIEKAASLLASYGPDGGGSFSDSGVTIIYRGFHNTRVSHGEAQPHVSRSGAVLTWDGRLDNRTELICEFRNTVSERSPDILIVAAAYERWGTESFPKLVGDWALSVWEPRPCYLVLAKDPIGMRHLYYTVDRARITWSTVLDPLVLCAGRSFRLDEEFVAGCLTFFPAPHLTPYVGIHSVAPSCLVRLTRGTRKTIRYWDFDSAREIRYRTDGEYEEHFRVAFAESVRRRLRSDAPVLAELSGGMDSSSIVCVADNLMADGVAETPQLDTVSYYDDSEPNWNERPYFTKVETRRARTGCHIDVSSQESYNLDSGSDIFAASPSSPGRPTPATKQLAACMSAQGNRVLLCGIGGDEVTGGVPTAIPELADLLARARLRTLAHKLTIWALEKRKTWTGLLGETLAPFLPLAFTELLRCRCPAPWLRSEFVRTYRGALGGYPRRLKFFGALPSFQQNLQTLDTLRRQVASASLPSHALYEKRYPYLDRSLIEFLFAIPREQLIRPGERRSLMRRALRGIVPQEILDRKRKAFVARAPMVGLSSEASRMAEISQDMVLSSLGIVDPEAFAKTLRKAHAEDVPIVPLVRTLAIECWLKSVRLHGTLSEHRQTRTGCLPQAANMACR